MANRPFTRNTGSLIEGTLQIGNLAVGVTNQDYTLNPGGKQWWDGPQEDSAYIIAKDFPSENKGSKIGNIGTVEFWGGNKTTSAFLNTVNTLPTRSGETDFTDINDAYDWLITNGYWSNITDDSSFIFDRRTRIVHIAPPPFTGSDDDPARGFDLIPTMFYNPSDSTTYLNYGEGPYYFDMGDFSGSDEYLRTSASLVQDNTWIPNNSYTAGANSYSYWTDINFFWQDQSTFSWDEYQERSIFPIAIDTASNYLYAGSKVNPNSPETRIYRFNLSTKTIQNTTDVVVTPPADIRWDPFYPNGASFDPVNDKLFLFKNDSIIAYTGSNLTTNTQSIDLSPYSDSDTRAAFPCSSPEITICPYSNFTGGSSVKGWVVVDNSAVTATTESFDNWPNYYQFLDQASSRPAYNPQNNQFYVPILKFGIGSNGETWVVIINGSTGEYIKRVLVQDSSGYSGAIFVSDLVYDPKRNVIWGINKSRRFFALNCEDDTFYKEYRFDGYTAIDQGAAKQKTSLVLDTSNDLLVWNQRTYIRTFDLNKFWPA